MLTDGALSDMQATKDLIVEIANRNLPLSIIIVGITFDGLAPHENPFAKMRELDADVAPLVDSKQQKAMRDIVQFVEFNPFAANPALLAQKTLEEVPQQFVGYMRGAKLVPKARSKAADMSAHFKVSESKMDLCTNHPRMKLTWTLVPRQMKCHCLPIGRKLMTTKEKYTLWITAPKLRTGSHPT
jgi:hypothetical protein